MAYVRAHGNQVTIVHGEREPETGKVVQHRLFTFYDRVEAEAAIGEQAGQFQYMLGQQCPWLTFDWPKIEHGIREHLDHLPEVDADYTRERREAFLDGIAGCVEQLVLTDPQHLYSSAGLIEGHRHELEYLRYLIDWRLKLAAEQKPNEWNRDTQFGWRSRLRDPGVPSETWDYVSDLYNKQKYNQVEAVCRVLLRRFPGWADGEAYLGRVAWHREELDDAVEHFERAVELGRKLFPKRMPKKSYWVNMDTRPFMRALRNLAMVLTDADRYDEALQVCDRLETECGDESVNLLRSPVYLLQGAWRQAREAATDWHRLHPSESYILAFTNFELDQVDDAKAYALHAIINRPRTGRMLAELPMQVLPAEYDEIEDHNDGVELKRRLRPYLDGRGKKARTWLRGLVENKRVKALVAEHAQLRKQWKAADGVEDRGELLRRMQEVESPEWARQQVEEGLRL